FQAEDGIRDRNVTGVQTCALPILLAGELDAEAAGDAVELLVELVSADATEVVATEVEEQALDELTRVLTGGRIARAQLLVDLDRSEERRVGKEGRAGLVQDALKIT